MPPRSASASACGSKLAALGNEPVGVGRDVDVQVQGMRREAGMMREVSMCGRPRPPRLVEQASCSAPRPAPGRSRRDCTPCRVTIEELLAFRSRLHASPAFAELRTAPGGGGDQLAKQKSVDVCRPGRRDPAFDQRSGPWSNHPRWCGACPPRLWSRRSWMILRRFGEPYRLAFVL